jgi:hypothetical protein
MRTTLTATALMALALGACRAPVVETGPAAPWPVVQPAPPPTADAVPAGTVLNLRLNQTLSTRHSRVGDRFTMTLLEPLVAQDGRVAIPAGAVVSGVVTGVSPGRHAAEPAAIRLNFDRLTVNARTYPFQAEVVDTEARAVHDQRQIAERAAIGAVIGAGLGAVIGGSLRDILIGGALGAGAGTIISLGWGDVAAEIPANTRVLVRTTQHLALR